MSSRFAEVWPEEVLERCAERVPGEPIPTPRKLSELQRPAENDPDELLKSHFLSRGGSLLLTGPTGIGKSSLAMQLACCWALGKDAFEIKPTGKLRSLIIQAENDDGDLAEMRDGIISGLELSPGDAASATDDITVLREDMRTGVGFCSVLDAALTDAPVDLVFIDPVFAYLGCDATAQGEVSFFLRNLLNPLLRTHNCAVILIHHTNKPVSGKEKPNWSAGDFAYLGSGSAEFANWARGVIALRSIGSHDVFELRLGKRGSRVGWKAEDGITSVYTKHIAHSQEGGQIFWREVPNQEADLTVTGNSSRDIKRDFLGLVPMEKSIPKDALISKAQATGIGINRARGFVTELVSDGVLTKTSIPRSGTRAEIHLSRSPQPSAPAR